MLACRRADGSATWQRQQGRQAAFFPLHDLFDRWARLAPGETLELAFERPPPPTR